MIYKPLKQVMELTKSQASHCERAGFITLADLLFAIPLRYEDRTKITPLAELQLDSEVLFQAKVHSTKIINGRNRQMFKASLTDGTDYCNVLFFNFSNHTTGNFRLGREGLFFGKVGFDSYEQSHVINHPKINWLDDPANNEFTPHINAVYGRRAAFRSFKEIIRRAIALLPAGAFRDAVEQLHFPTSLTEVAAAKELLAEEELLAHQFSLAKARENRKRELAPQLTINKTLIDSFHRQLPFQLTAAQKKVIGEINADLAQPYPMMRLVQGDVGSGKTMVALEACLSAVAAGKQACMLAPTELLAQQHFNSMQKLLGELPVQLALLTSKNRKALAAIGDGSAQIVVGTHALFQEKVQYQDLALVVIDEQHRFGVEQRQRLRQKSVAGLSPHQLILTATPIPRTLAMSSYGELDLSVIDVPPAGRTPVQTMVFSNSRREEIIQRVGENCRSGRQAYWVCPYIDEAVDLSEGPPVENVLDLTELLRQRLPDVKIALLHGKTPSDDRQAIMEHFAANEISLLVATTVIEVGVDVPNASLMIVENAERFGLAQLHQLRGRVGRGEQQSYCLLLYQSELTELAQRRLAMMRQTTDGFAIAEADLELRGSGDMSGTRQAGSRSFYFVEFPRHRPLLQQVQARLDLNSAEQQMIYNNWCNPDDDYLQS